MRYSLFNKNVNLHVHTWDCRVTVACEGMQWAIGKHIDTVLHWCERKRIRWEVAQ